MSFIQSEAGGWRYFVTSGATASGFAFNIAAQNTLLGRVIYEHNGTVSGITLSILDTQSGTIASGLWVLGSGARRISFNSPLINSGKSQDPIAIEYNIRVNSGICIFVSGGTSGTDLVRVTVAYA